MSLTSGVQAAAASPVAAQLAIIDSVLTAAGWTQLTQKSAATMGTTDVVEVFIDPNTTVSSNVYTGMILFIETDETNNRMRFRVSEVYDSAAAGSPALNVKWAAPGNLHSTAQTATASAAFDDSFIALFQATGASQKVGWCNIPMSDSGFDYWLGANDKTFIYTNNSSGTVNTVIAGRLQYMGDLFTATGNVAVYLSGNQTGMTAGTMSWTTSGDTLNTGGAFGVRFSRQPDQASASMSGAFVGLIGAPVMSEAQSSSSVHGAPVLPHRLYSTFLLFPAWIHGSNATTAGGTLYNGASSSTVGSRSNLAIMPEFAVHLSGTFTPGGATAFNSLISPAFGDVVDLDGTSYFSLGLYQKVMNNASGGWNIGLLVDGSQF